MNKICQVCGELKHITNFWVNKVAQVGSLQDDPEILRAAADYIELHRGIT